MRTTIRFKGQIDEHWSAWFEDLEILHDRERDESLLCGEVLDQAALYGLLAKLRDLGLDLLSVTVSDPCTVENGAVDNGAANLGAAEALDN
jgi:hypothetical protein